MYFHLILKDKRTFDTVDFNFCTSVSVSGTDYSITYYDDSTLTTPHTATYVFANYYVYVVPVE
jgi:hypothetical protein